MSQINCAQLMVAAQTAYQWKHNWCSLTKKNIIYLRKMGQSIKIIILSVYAKKVEANLLYNVPVKLLSNKNSQPLVLMARVKSLNWRTLPKIIRIWVWWVVPVRSLIVWKNIALAMLWVKSVPQDVSAMDVRITQRQGMTWTRTCSKILIKWIVRKKTMKWVN